MCTSIEQSQELTCGADGSDGFTTAETSARSQNSTSVELMFGVAEWDQSAEKVPGRHHQHSRAAAVRAALSCDICPLAELHRPEQACSEVVSETAGLSLMPLFKDDVLYYA